MDWVTSAAVCGDTLPRKVHRYRVDRAWIRQHLQRNVLGRRLACGCRRHLDVDSSSDSLDQNSIASDIRLIVTLVGASIRDVCHERRRATRCDNGIVGVDPSFCPAEPIHEGMIARFIIPKVDDILNVAVFVQEILASPAMIRAAIVGKV